MAKGNLFLGQARGKVGSIVFSRAFGKQITRTRATSVANPKTIGQNTQRAILATVAKAAAVMNPLVDHSFANVTYGAESVRHFRKVNMGILRQMYLNASNSINLTAKGGSFVPNPLKISEGNLPSFFAVVNDDDISFRQSAVNDLPSGQDITVADFLKAYPSIQGGDQITLVKVSKINQGSLLDGDAAFTMSLDRIVFAANAFDDLTATIITAEGGVIADNFLDLTRTTDPECLSFNSAGNGLGFTSDGEVYYAALILSRKVNNVWQRSAQYLEQIEFDDHTDNDSAIDSYGASASISGDTEYLNQADDSEQRGGISVPYMNIVTQVGDGDPSAEKINAGTSGSSTITQAANTSVKISAMGFAGADATRQPFFTVYKGNTQVRVRTGSINYTIIVNADNAGAWKVEAVFADGSKAVYDITIAVQG